jgi:hypothetical protein
MTQIRSVLDIPIFHKIYDFYKLLHSYHPRIPKCERYTIWQRCENITLSILETIIESGHKNGDDRKNALYNLCSVFLPLQEDCACIV